MHLMIARVVIVVAVGRLFVLAYTSAHRGGVRVRLPRIGVGGMGASIEHRYDAWQPGRDQDPDTSRTRGGT
jgi:hypothetical protein